MSSTRSQPFKRTLSAHDLCPGESHFIGGYGRVGPGAAWASIISRDVLHGSWHSQAATYHTVGDQNHPPVSVCLCDTIDANKKPIMLLPTYFEGQSMHNSSRKKHSHSYRPGRTTPHLVKESRLPVSARPILGEERPEHRVVQIGAPRSILRRGGNFFRRSAPKTQPR